MYAAALRNKINELTRCATSLMSFSSCGIMKTTLYGKLADVCFPL